MRRAAKVDANQAALVRFARSLGAVVWDTSGLGGGFPDLVLAFQGHLYLAEIKDGRKPPSARKLTDAEGVFHDLFGTVAPRWVKVIEDEDGLLRMFGMIGEGEHVNN